jgi:hypothetical protein
MSRALESLTNSIREQILVYQSFDLIKIKMPPSWVAFVLARSNFGFYLLSS